MDAEPADRSSPTRRSPPHHRSRLAGERSPVRDSGDGAERISVRPAELTAQQRAVAETDERVVADAIVRLRAPPVARAIVPRSAASAGLAVHSPV